VSTKFYKATHQFQHTVITQQTKSLAVGQNLFGSALDDLQALGVLCDVLPLMRQLQHPTQEAAAVTSPVVMQEKVDAVFSQGQDEILIGC
jgi:hypothetical protein